MGPRLVMLNISGAGCEVGNELQAQVEVYLARNKVHDALWQSPLAHTHTHKQCGRPRSLHSRQTMFWFGCFATWEL